MKKEVALTLLGCGGILFLAAGCAPELAQVPVGQEEKNWDKVLKQNYYSFQPPHTPAPASYQPAPAAKAVGQKELPEAVEDPAGIVDRAAAPAESVTAAPAQKEGDEKKPAELQEAPKADPAAAPAGDKNAKTPAAPASGENAESAVAAPEKSVEYSKPYIVQSGDSLGKIAIKFYGKSSMGDVIYKANSKVITAPDKLRPGMKLVIPEL